MALIKHFIDECGVDTSYWKIIAEKSIRIDTQVEVTLTLAGYYNKEARLANYLPRETRDVSFRIDVLTPIPNISMISAYYYQIIALVPEFADALFDEDEE
jgi:hypothetical protein